MRLPRYTQFTIKNIISQNNSPYVFLELENIDGKNYKIKAAFTHTSVVDVILQSDNYFTDLFGIGNLRTKYPNITEEVVDGIRAYMEKNGFDKVSDMVGIVK